MLLNTETQPEIKSELQKFIYLLQKGQLNLGERSSRDMGKLSTIFSSSQPEYSSGDKEDSNSSANRSHSSAELMDIDGKLFKWLEASGMSIEQRKYLDKIKKTISGIKCLVVNLEAKCESLERDYGKEKKGTDQLLKALIQMDQAEKEVWNSYSLLNTNYKGQKITLESLEVENMKLQEIIKSYVQDNEFMKRLVLVANENYQILEKKCRQMEIESKGNQSSRRSMMQRSFKIRKQSFSPSGSDIVNLSPIKQQFKGVYRNMVLRTLKSKFRQGNH